MEHEYDSLVALVLDAVILALDNDVINKELEEGFSRDYKDGYHLAVDCIRNMRESLKEEKKDGSSDDL